MLLSFVSNRKFAAFYTSDLSAATAEEFKEKKEEIYRVGEKALSAIRYNDYDAKCVAAFMETAQLGHRVFKTLADMISGNWHPVDHNEPFFKPTSWEKIVSLRELIAQLETSTNDRTFAFEYYDGWYVYHHKQIVRPKEFRLLMGGLNRVLPGTKLMLVYDQLMPFTNANHNDQNCVPVRDLPQFYKNKGVTIYDQ